MAKHIIAVFEILILTILFALLAAFSITNNQNTAITEHTENFVELVRYKGCITETMYNDFLNSFDTAIDVSISVEKQPVLANSNAAATYDFTKEVMAAVETDGIYCMRTRDSIQVTVSKASGTMFDTIVGKTTGNRTQGQSTIVAVKGGLILNEQYEAVSTP